MDHPWSSTKPPAGWTGGGYAVAMVRWTVLAWAGGLVACSQLPGVVVVDPARADAGVQTMPVVDADAGVSVPDAGMVVTSLDAGVGVDSGLITGEVGPTCFPEIYRPNLPNPRYEQFSPAVATHCAGTNHQDIRNVQRVVFLGDSITAGTPPTAPAAFYRTVLTRRLTDLFGPQLEVANCSRVGARINELLHGDNPQIPTCFPEMVDPRPTLVVMTMGGNDLADLQRAGSDGAPLAQTRAMVEAQVALMEEAVTFLKQSPERFPGGVFVVFANLWEYTDGTGDVDSCVAVRLIGITGVWPDAEQLIIWANEQYMRIAVEQRADLVLLMETFCGHGFHNDDETARCYRGPDTPRWFDLTCIHPTPEGHTVVADLFYNVIAQ